MSYLKFVATMTGESGSWSIDSFLKNLQNSLGTWAQFIVVIIGLIMLVVGIFQVARGMMSSGRGQTNWFLAIALIFIGGALAFSGGWGIVRKVSKSGQETINDLGDGNAHNRAWQNDSDDSPDAIIIDMGDYIISE